MAVRQRFHPLQPGSTIPDDWHSGVIPDNIEVGDNTMIDTSWCFHSFRSRQPIGARIGHDVTIARTSFAVERDATVEIGDFCYLDNASLACASRISIGSHVLLATGVSILDSDFHPIDVAERTLDAVALSPVGDPAARPSFESRPVVIEDNVRIGPNATVLKGVRVGAGAVVAAGAVVIGDVPPGAHVAGNPAHVIEGGGE